jgi:ribonuclease BN (tRNA processing enzyme)
MQLPIINLKFFGTSNANPHPNRRQSGLLLTVDRHHYLFDCGDGIATALWNSPDVDFNRFHAVFFSHRHPDHLGGLTSLLLLLHQRLKHYNRIDVGRINNRELPPKSAMLEQEDGEFTVMLPGTEIEAEAFMTVIEMSHISNFETTYLKKIYPFTGKHQIFRDQYISVSSFPTKHAPDSSGFIIETCEKRILYSGDISHPKVVAEAMDSNAFDVVIIENAHFPTKAIAEALQGKAISHLIITHCNDRILQDLETARGTLEPLAITMKIIFAEDGQTLDI